MKIRCKYSGIEFRAEFFDKYNFTHYHPIFDLSARELLVRAKDWNTQSFSEQENKLLFLALLNRTNSVRWDYWADPSPSIVARNMNNMFKLLGHSDLIDDGSILLPKFAITYDNYQLTNIHNWIGAWNEAKQDWLDPIKRQYLWKSLREKLDGREKVLTKLINSPYKKSEQYAGRLASWAMIAGDVPQNLREFWTTLFKLKDNEIYSVRKVDLEELIEHMESHLYVSIGNMDSKSLDLADKTLEHVRGLLKEHDRGRLGHLNGGEFFSILDDDYVTPTNSSHVGANVLEKYNATVIALSAPAEEPNLAQYRKEGKMMQYLKDKAAWTLAKSLKEKEARGAKLL